MCLLREGLRSRVLLRHSQRFVAEPASRLRLQPAVDADGAQRRGPDPGLQTGHQTGTQPCVCVSHHRHPHPPILTGTGAPDGDSSAAKKSLFARVWSNLQ